MKKDVLLTNIVYTVDDDSIIVGLSDQPIETITYWNRVKVPRRLWSKTKDLLNGYSLSIGILGSIGCITTRGFTRIADKSRQRILNILRTKTGIDLIKDTLISIVEYGYVRNDISIRYQILGDNVNTNIIVNDPSKSTDKTTDLSWLADAIYDVMNN